MPMGPIELADQAGSISAWRLATCCLEIRRISLPPTPRHGCAEEGRRRELGRKTKFMSGRTARRRKASRFARPAAYAEMIDRLILPGRMFRRVLREGSSITTSP